MSRLVEAAAAAYGLMFLAAGFGKIDAWSNWSVTVSSIFPLGHSLNRLIRYGTPCLELGVAGLVWQSPEFGLALSSGLLLGLAIVVLVANRNLGGRPCTCFGAVAPTSFSPRLAMRNLTLSALAGAMTLLATKGYAANLSIIEIGLVTWIGFIALLILQYRRIGQRPTLWKHGGEAT